MGGGCGTDQGVVVAAGAARRGLDQGAVVRLVDRMGDVPRTRMAGGAVAAESRDTGLQVRNGRVAEAAIAQMRSGHRRIRRRARIVTGQA